MSDNKGDTGALTLGVKVSLEDSMVAYDALPPILRGCVGEMPMRVCPVDVLARYLEEGLEPTLRRMRSTYAACVAEHRRITEEALKT